MKEFDKIQVLVESVSIAIFFLVKFDGTSLFNKMNCSLVMIICAQVTKKSVSEADLADIKKEEHEKLLIAKVHDDIFLENVV